MNVRCLIVWLLGYALSYTSVYADCQAPQSTYMYSLTHQSVSLSWSYYGSSSPSYQLQWRMSGNESWNTLPVMTLTYTTLTDLTNNTTYEWRVRTICAVGDTSAYTGIQAFQTKCDLPLYLSTTNVTHQSAQLEWYASGSYATYELQWRPTGTATWTIVSGLTTNSLALKGLPEDTSFEWKVRTICSATATSDFSTGPFFRTRCLPPLNVRVSLTNPNAVELKWDSPTANVRFDLQWRLAGATDWVLVENITSTEYVLAGLTNTTNYEWQVRTVCSATSKSTFSDSQLFQTSCLVPTNLTVSSVTHNSAIIQWTSFSSDLQWRAAGATDWTTVSNAKSPYLLTGLANNAVYECRVRTVCSPTVVSAYTSAQLLTTKCLAPSGGYSNPIYTNERPYQLSWYSDDNGPFEVQWRVSGTGSWAVITGIVSTNYSLTGLSPATTYEWRVRKLCSATEYSDFLAGQSFTTSCNIPTYTRNEKATNATIDLAWNAGEPGGRYEVQWRIVNTPDWTTISDIVPNRYTLTELQVNTPYEWRVRKLCSATVASPFADGQPFTLNCAQPTSFNTSSINFSSATVAWSGSYIYAPYEVQYRQAGANDWIAITNLTTNQYSLSNLSNNTTYEWRVRSACPSAVSPDFSAVQTFQTQCSIQVFSINRIVDYNSATLYWQDNSNTRLYEIQYRETGSTNWIILKPEGTETDPYFGETTYSYVGRQYTIYNLAPGKTYEWRLRAQCTPSIYSDFVSGPTLETNCLMPQDMSGFQLTNTTLEIAWYLPSYPARYDLQWRTAGAETWNTVSGITSKSYTLTNLTPGSSYEYRVRRVCSPGVLSEFSVSRTTTMRCLTPNSLSTEILSASSALLKWSYYTGFDASTINNEIHYRVLGTSDWTTITGVIGASYSLTGITTDVSYEWQVRAVCSPDITSDFSTPYTFRLSCSPPYVNSYYTQIGSTSAILSWNFSSPWTKSYLLQWRSVGDATWVNVPVAYSGTTIIYSYSLAGLTTSTNYEWRIATNCGDGYLSDFSTTQSFQTACPSVTDLTVQSVKSTSAQLNWSGASSLLIQSNYTIQYRVRGTAVWSELSGITSPATQLTGLASNTTYEWRVRADCEAGVATKFSNINTFSTQCPNPDNLYAYAITTQSALLSWVANTENSAVNLQWRAANTNSAWNEVNGLTGSGYSLTGLTPATYYEYRLQGVCATSQTLSPTRGVVGFTTLAPNTSPLSIYPDSISALAVRLNWITGPNKTNYILQWRVRNGNWNTTGPLSAKRYLLTGLTPNTTYDVRLSYVEDGVTYEASTSFVSVCPRFNYFNTVNITSTSAQLMWAAIGFPELVRWPVSVQWRVAGTTAWNTVTGLTSNTYALTGLSDNVNYEWRIQTLCSADVTNDSYPASFQTICQTPLSAFTQKITTGSALLSWTGSGSTYSVQYRVIGTSTWATVTGLTSTTYALSGLTNNTTYEWAVATVCASGGSSIYTIPIAFKTQCSLPISLNVSALTATQVLLTWDSPEPAHELQWRAVGSTIWSTSPAVISPYTLTGLVTGKNYEWRVRATCATASDGPFASGNSFVSQCPSFYNINKYTLNVTGSMAQLTWSSNSALTYGLRWRAVGSNTWTDVPGNVTTPYTLTGLTNNTGYEWQILTECQAIDGASQFFQTHCNSPVSLWMEGITTTSARLLWNDSKDGQGYEVQWRVAGTSTWTSISGITSTSCLLSGLTNYTDYEWQVRSQCGSEAPFQLTTSFKTANDCPSGIYTVRAGSWDDPAVWSCNRIPTLTDQIKLNHTLVIPNAYVAKALTIRYEIGAKLTLGIGASVKVGN